MFRVLINNYFIMTNISYICIQIEVPFIKIKKHTLLLKDKSSIKIIGRTYESTFNTPCNKQIKLINFIKFDLC